MGKNSRRTNRALLLTGILAGAAAAYYLTTPSGKKLTKDTIAKGKEMKGMLSEKTTVLINDAKDKASEAVDSANEIASSLNEKIASTKNSLLETMEEKSGKLQDGIKKMKKSINNTATV